MQFSSAVLCGQCRGNLHCTRYSVSPSCGEVWRSENVKFDEDLIQSAAKKKKRGIWGFLVLKTPYAIQPWRFFSNTFVPCHPTSSPMFFYIYTVNYKRAKLQKCIICRIWAEIYCTVLSFRFFWSLNAGFKLNRIFTRKHQRVSHGHAYILLKKPLGPTSLCLINKTLSAIAV